MSFNATAFAAVLLCGLLLSACTGASGNSGPAPAGALSAEHNLMIVDDLPPPEGMTRGSGERVAENDVIDVDFFLVDELDREVRVDAGGEISLALVGRIGVAGKTVPEIERQIERLYADRYLQNPEVTISISDSAGNRITIDGEVRKPGIYPVSSTSTLLEVIARAGGFTEIADERKLYVFRKTGSSKLVANYDVGRIREGMRRDPRIFGGDVIISFSSKAKIAARDLREALGIASNAASIAAPF